MRLAVVGATGRTGSEVVAEGVDRGHDVVGVARSPRSVGDVPVRAADELPDVLADVDAAVEFATPAATRGHAPVVAEAGVPYVVGTTGIGDEGAAALRDASESAPVLQASNFARGVQALLRVVEAGVAALPDYDVELTETHHSGKRDAPSGTANTILDAVDEARAGGASGTSEGSDGGGEADDTEGDEGTDGEAPEDLERVHGREGEYLREDGEVGVHVRRAGTVRGEHELLLAGNDEVLTLTHRAESRRVFAAGALDAAEWLVDREPGRYEFADLL